MAYNMGLGKLGSPNIVFKQKWRWIMHIIDPVTEAILVPHDIVKVAARPSLNIEETELEFLNKTTWIPGKTQFETMTITYMDCEQSYGAEYFYKFLGDISSPNYTPRVATFVLSMVDWTGTTIETWKLKDAFVTSVNFGELDHSQSEPVSLEIQFKYKTAEYIYNNPVKTAHGIGEEFSPGGWQIPEEWVIRNPIVTESSSPGERILDQFLRRMASK